MAEWVIPVEQETGVPLAIAPPEDGLPPVGIQGFGANWHHLVYPRTRKEHTSVSGSALRQIRLEWTDVGEHRSFHHYFDEYMAEQWEFPKTVHQRFGMVVLMAAHYVPPWAIKISREGPSYVELDEKDRQSMWKTGILRIASEYAVYEFIRDYMLEQNLNSFVDELDIDIFLNTNDDQQRVATGNKLLEAAAEAATDDIRPTYLDVYKKRLLTPDTPKEPKELIISEPTILGTERRKRKARTALRQKLAKQRGVDLINAA